MSDQLIPQGDKALANVPSYAQTGDEGSNLLGDMGGASFPRLTFKGSRFRVVVGEEETVLKTTELNVVILDAFPKVSRIFFKGTYGEDGADTRPLCASADGEVPLDTVAHPQSDKCAVCPQNQKGSAISDDGGKRRACSYFKRVAFYLLDYPDFGPVVADMKSMSLFGDSYTDKGYLNLRAYGDLLARHKTKPEAVVTELSFDTNASVPKILFRAASYVSEEMYMETIKPLQDSGTPEMLVDTTQIRTEGMGDGSKPQGGGFRDKLLEQDKPEHADKKAKEEPEEPEEGDAEQEDEKPAKATKKKATKKKAAKKKAVKKKAAKKPEPEADHPKFCGDCGAKWGSCEHTGAKVEEPADEEQEEEEDGDEFDDELERALEQYAEGED